MPLQCCFQHIVDASMLSMLCWGKISSIDTTQAKTWGEEKEKREADSAENTGSILYKQTTVEKKKISSLLKLDH